MLIRHSQTINNEYLQRVVHSAAEIERRSLLHLQKVVKDRQDKEALNARDPFPLEVNDYALMSNNPSKMGNTPPHKLSVWWMGPRRVEKIVSNTVYLLDLTTKNVTKYDVCRLKKYVGDNMDEEHLTTLPCPRGIRRNGWLIASSTTSGIHA
jgi:hypothetical protein